MKSDKFQKGCSNEIQSREKSHLIGKTRDKFMAAERNLDNDYRIVVNVGQRTFQKRAEVGKQEHEDAQRAEARPV